jgi:hypothetical protein
MGLLYGRAGRLTVLFGGFRPGQYNIFAYGDRFDPPYIAAFTATLRRFAPWLMFAPTTYFRLEGEELFAKMPSLALVLDAPHFPFRGEGMGKCNATAARPCPVPFPDRCSFCLAGDCGIATIPGAVDDIRSIYAHFAPLGRQIITGVIATRHSTCGTPSAKYVAATLPVLAAAEGVGALYVFRLVAPATNDTSCTSPAVAADKGCIVRNFYGQLSRKTDEVAGRPAGSALLRRDNDDGAGSCPVAPPMSTCTAGACIFTFVGLYVKRREATVTWDCSTAKGTIAMKHGALAAKTDDASPRSEDTACVKLAESWCTVEPLCRAFGVFNDMVQLHSCNVTMPNSDWRIYAKSNKNSYTLLPGKVDINASACTTPLPGRKGGTCLPKPQPSEPCGWAPGATPCAPAPPRPYRVLGSVSTGVLEASIFLWHGTEMMLENLYCEDSSKKGYPSPDHYGRYDSRFANHSYARIRELKTGRFVANISETIGTSFVSPFVDTDTDTLWLAANDEDRCVHQCGVGVLVFSSKDLVSFTSARAMEIQTCNIDIARVPSPPPGLPAHRYAMLVEDNTIYLNNEADGNLSHGWFHGGSIDYPGAPGGGPSINYVSGVNDGYYYTLTGGNKVYVSRSKDLKAWEGPKEFCRPTPDDANVAHLLNFPAEASARGFDALQANWTQWDWFTGQGWAAAGVEGTWLMWDASTQGGKSRLPSSFMGSSCSNVVAHSNLTLGALLGSFFSKSLRDIRATAVVTGRHPTPTPPAPPPTPTPAPTPRPPAPPPPPPLPPPPPPHKGPCRTGADCRRAPLKRAPLKLDDSVYQPKLAFEALQHTLAMQVPKSDASPLPMFHAWPDQPESQDITGLVFRSGLWHLFVDCLPDPNPLFGPNCTGHCTPLSWCHLSSPDLVSWSQEPVAIRPDSVVDACCAETGGVTMTPNGTIFALYSTINNTSWDIAKGGAWDGDLALAIATDTTLRHWTKHGAVADNLVHKFRTEASSPFPGINSAQGFKDAAAPWLDFCSPTGEGPRCWFTLVSSGGDLSGKPVPPMTEACLHLGLVPPCPANLSAVALLLKTENELDLTHWAFVKLFHSHAIVKDRVGFSCVDFFRLSDQYWGFGSYYSRGSKDEKQYTLGTYANHTFIPVGPGGRMPDGEIWKTGGVGVDHVGAVSRRVYVGTVPLSVRLSRNGVQHGGYTASLPKDLFVNTFTGEPLLGMRFVPELQTLRSSTAQTGYFLEVLARFSTDEPARSYGVSLGQSIMVTFQGTSVGILQGGDSLAVMPLVLGRDEGLSLHLYVDAALVECCANSRACFSAHVKLEGPATVSIFGTSHYVNTTSWRLAKPSKHAAPAHTTAVFRHGEAVVGSMISRVLVSQKTDETPTSASSSRHRSSSSSFEILVDAGLAGTAPAYDIVDGSTRAAATAVVVGSVHEAKAVIRSVLAVAKTTNVMVRLAPGAHAPLELGPEDSAAAGSTVTWTSADLTAPATISAAVKVSGWRLDPARPGVLTAPIPAALKAAGTTVRHLWVSGIRAAKPRYYPRCETGNCFQRSEVLILPNSSMRHGTELPWGGYYFNTTALDPSTFENPLNVEFVYTGRAGARGDPPSGARDDHQSGEDPWTEMRCSIDSVHGRTVAIKRPCWEALPFAGAEDTGAVRGHQPPSYLDNVHANFTTPGQWYLNSSADAILYRPRPGETLSDVANSATTAGNSTLLVLNGARNLRWVGVRFEYAVWDPLKSHQQGFVDIQSAQIFNGSVLAASSLQLNAVRNISFSSCEFRHLGSVYAIAAEGGSKGLTVENCSFSDCSGGGLKFGQVANCSTGCANAGPSKPGSNPGADSQKGNQWWPVPSTPDEEHDGGLLVTNSLFTAIPNEFHGANAIFVGYARDVEISHNTISNTSYSAISIGGGWPKKPSYGGNIHAVYNHIVDAMQLLADGGFIYSTSDGRNSTLAYNHLDGDPVQYGGIYHDGGSANWKDTQNVIENVRSSCIFAHGSCPNISESWSWCNNTGGLAIQGQAHSLSCNIDMLNRTNWARWPPQAQKIIDGAGRKACWPHCPPPAPAPSPPCPAPPPPAPPPPAPPGPPGPGPPPPRSFAFGAAECNASKISQRWSLSPGVRPGSSRTTSIKSATVQSGCLEITGCTGSTVGTSYGCKPLPKPGSTDKCANNGAWKLHANGTITSVMAPNECLQVDNGGDVSVRPCSTSAGLATTYVRLPQRESCQNGTVLLTKAQCSAAFVALVAILPEGAKDNTKCCNGDSLPYGCTYRTDNDLVYNENKASTSTYASGGWRAVCASAAASQTFVITAVKVAKHDPAVEVTVEGGGLCVDNDAEHYLKTDDNDNTELVATVQDRVLPSGRTVAQGSDRNIVQNPDFVTLDPKSGQPAHWSNIGTGTPSSRVTAATGSPSSDTVSLLFNGTDPKIYKLVAQSMPIVQPSVPYSMSVMIKTMNLSSSAGGGYASITGSWKMRAPSTKPSGGTWPKGPGDTSDGFIKVLQSFTLPADAVPGSFVLALYVRPRMQGGPTPTGMA